MELKYLNVPFEMKANREDEEYFYFEGYASTFGNVDLGNDVIERGAFIKSLKARNPKLLWQHKMDMPLGVFEEVFEDDKGLFVKGKMPLADSFVRDRVIPQMKIKSVDSMSIGYCVEIEEYDKTINVRKLKEIYLYEASLVTLPMNPQATVTGMKALEMRIDELKTLKDINNYLKDCGLSKVQVEGVMAKMRTVINECNTQEQQSKSDAELAELVKASILNLEKITKEIQGV